MFDRWLEEARLLAYRAVLYECKTRKDKYGQAEDAASQAVLEALKLGDGHFNDRIHVVRFVVRRAKERVRDVWKSAYLKRRKTLGNATDREGDSTAVDSAAIQQELAGVIRRALDAVGSLCREILTLYYVASLSDSEIAKQMLGDQAADADRQRIGTQRRNCLNKMRRGLQNSGVDPNDWW